MALQTQLIDILFQNGIDTKTDPALVPSGSLLSAINTTRLKSGRLSKRKGFESLGDTTFSTPEALLTYQKELVAIADNALYSYDSTADSWVNKDDLAIPVIDESPIYKKATVSLDRPGVAIYNNLAIYTWVDSNGIYYTLRDLTTNTDIIINKSSTLSCASGQSYTVQTLGNKFIILANGGSSLIKYATVSAVAGHTQSTGTLTNDFDSTAAIFTSQVYDSMLYVSYLEAGGNIRTRVFNTSLALTNVQDITATPANALAMRIWESETDNETYLALAWNDASNDVRAFIYNANLVQIVGDSQLDTSQTNVKKIIVCELPTADDTCRIVWDRYDATTPANTYLRTNTLDSGGVRTGQGVMAKSVDIYSQPFVYNNRVYYAVKHESSLQPSIFLLQMDTAAVVSILAQSVAGVIETSPFASPIANYVNSQFYMGMDVRGRLISENNTLFTLTDTSSVKVDFDIKDKYNAVEAGGLLYFAGGMLHHYDGKKIVEAGFVLYPEGISNSGTATTGGSISNGTYQYTAVYTWYDNQGNRHQSAPSESLSVTVSGGTSTQTIDIDIPTLRLTRKYGSAGDVIVDLYRTEDAGGIFYKVSSLTSVTANNLAVDSVTITDSTSDTNLISNEILYTEGGVLDNICPPASKRLEVFDNRLFLGGTASGGELRYSKTIIPGVGIAFNESLVEYIPESKEDVTALKTLDSNLILFKETKIFAMSGSGPSATGEGSSFISPESITSDTGAVDSRSIVTSTEGVYFKSRKGIYLLSRGLDTSYIGAPVEDFNSHNITSATLSAITNEVRFTTDNRTTLNYNYLYNQWFTFEHSTIQSATDWNNQYAVLFSTGVTAKESPTFRDLGAFYPMKVQTGWLKLSNLEGYQRVKRVAFYGSYNSDHKVRIKVFTNYSDTVKQTVVFDPTTILSKQEYFGDDTPFGTQSLFGGTPDNDVYSFQFHVKEQKCSSIRFEFEDIIDPGVDYTNSGAAMSLVGFSLLIGTKRGIHKVRSGRKG